MTYAEVSYVHPAASTATVAILASKKFSYSPVEVQFYGFLDKFFSVLAYGVNIQIFSHPGMFFKPLAQFLIAHFLDGKVCFCQAVTVTSVRTGYIVSRIYGRYAGCRDSFLSYGHMGRSYIHELAQRAISALVLFQFNDHLFQVSDKKHGIQYIQTHFPGDISSVQFLFQ